MPPGHRNPFPKPALSVVMPEKFPQETDADA
jgi:hypothetical protein